MGIFKVRRKGVGWETAVFLLFFALSILSLRQLGPTFDEQGFITRGLGYLRGENSWMRVGHPLGLNALNAALLVTDETVQLPTDDPAWQLPNFHRPAELFLWEIGNDVTHIMFLARLPTIWLGLLLLAFVYRWARESSGQRWAALLALALAAFDSNLIANGRLATTDFGLMSFAFLAGYLLWRFGKRPSWPRAIWAGVGFGLLQNSKFTAGLFVPIFTLILLLFALNWLNQSSPRPRFFSRHSPFVMLIVAYPLAGFLTLWAAYGFQIGTLPDNLPSLPQLSGLTLPLSHHLEQLLDIGGRLQKSTPAFLAGSYSDSGWWYYFPVAFLLKTPLPTLILFVVTTIGVAWLALRRQLGGRWLLLAALLLPPLGYFGFALGTDINLGYRHLLPVLPFFFVYIATGLSWLPHTRWRPWAVLGAVIWLGGTAVYMHPHHLAFFNALAGGPDNGWRYLVDSNIDWGQDLGRLDDWMAENDVAHVWLSYFGEGRPSYYNINYTGLDSFPPRLMNAQARPFYPYDPAPGTYAISATTLQGVQFANHDTFAWFRSREPLGKVGYSIFIYEVPPRGEPVDVLLAGVQLDEIAPDDFALFQTNQVVPRWLPKSTAFLQPQSADFWLVADDAFDASWLETAVSPTLVQQTRQYRIYRLSSTVAAPQAGWQFILGDAEIELLDLPFGIKRQNDRTLQVTTRWRNNSPPTPLKIYLHVVDVSGQIVAQWDGLDIAWEGWRMGDVLWQKHNILLPDNMPEGEYSLRIGLYDPETSKRWLTPSGADYLLLDEWVVGP